MKDLSTACSPRQACEPHGDTRYREPRKVDPN